jgi:hypothetical protein
MLLVSGVQFHLPVPLKPGCCMVAKRTPPMVVVVPVIILGMVFSGQGSGQGQSSNRTPAHLNAGVSRTSQLANEPAGASRCAFCHQSEVQGYARSAMAHSLRRAGHEPDGTVETRDAKITMHSAPTGYWQPPRERRRHHQLSHRLRDRLRQSRLRLSARCGRSSVPVPGRLLQKPPGLRPGARL